MVKVKIDELQRLTKLAREKAAAQAAIDQQKQEENKAKEEATFQRKLNDAVLLAAKQWNDSLLLAANKGLDKLEIVYGDTNDFNKRVLEKAIQLFSDFKAQITTFDVPVNEEGPWQRVYAVQFDWVK